MRRLITETSKLKIINNLLVMLVAVIGISSKQFDLDEMTMFQSLLVEVVAPIQKGVVTTQESFASMVDNYLRIVNTNKENLYLKKRMEELENDIFQMEETRKENLRLKQMLSYSEELPYEKIMAKVIGWDSANQFKVLRINKGEQDGIKVMDPVITQKGLVGYVYRVGYNYADILTILDPNNRVDALVERTRTHGIVEGVFNFKCALKYVNKNEQIEIGDKLVTAGVGGVYPKGIKVGLVSQMDRETSGMTLNLEITPSVDFNKLEEVLVLKAKGNMVITDTKEVTTQEAKKE